MAVVPITGTGVVTDDFGQILSDLGRTISWKKATKTVDASTGSETTTYANASNVSVAFFLKEHHWNWETMGFVKLGDAYVIAKKPSIVVSGTLSPDATGTYTFVGTFNGRNYYTRANDYYLFQYTAGSQWVIAASLAFNPAADAYWSLDGTAPRTELGTYTLHNAATGSPLAAYGNAELGRYDQFTIDEDTYYIEEAESRTVAAGVQMLDFCVCFKVG